jgi:spore germination cell wall hydrolase CwlJ-like protein
MKRTLNCIYFLIVLAAIGAASYGSATSQFQHTQVARDTPMIISEVVEISTPPADTQIPEIHFAMYEPEELFLNLTFEEQELLEQIAMAEAKGEGSKGMALVMCVILNRSEKEGKSIEDVIFASGQFYTAGMEPGSDACHEALAMVMDGWDESEGALFFNRDGYRTGREPLFKYGNHYFSK